MSDVLIEYGIHPDGTKVLGFHCPGCGHVHTFRVGGKDRPQWTWDGRMDKPTFSPSLLCFHEHQGQRVTDCHSFVRDGKIEFLSDCRHKLAGQTVPLEIAENWR